MGKSSVEMIFIKYTIIDTKPIIGMPDILSDEQSRFVEFVGGRRGGCLHEGNRKMTCMLYFWLFIHFGRLSS